MTQIEGDQSQLSNIQCNKSKPIWTRNVHPKDLEQYRDILQHGRARIEIPYRSKLKVLAPMVRVGQLPFREICQGYGADVVFTEELIDRALLKTKRHVNEELGIIEYLDENNRPIFQSSPSEKNLVLQIGTPNSEQALKTAMHTYLDYDCIDINCGCPKNFSIKGQMGAYLLRPNSRERLQDILRTLTKNIEKPVTCKIRLLDSISDTIDLVKMIESTGVHAITIHGRYISQRPSEPAWLDKLALVKEHAKVPIIANGDCFTHSDIQLLYDITKCDSIMIARGALYNPSVFQEMVVPPCEIAIEWIKLSELYRCKLGYVKYSVKRMFEKESKMYPHTQLVNKIDTYNELLSIFDNWESKLSSQYEKPNKRQRLNSSEGVVQQESSICSNLEFTSHP